MKKFGTPILAAPGSASEYVGSFCGGRLRPASSGTGVGVAASATLPVSDSVLASPAALLAASSTFSSACLVGLSAFVLGLAGAAGLRCCRASAWRWAWRVAVGGRRRLDGDRRRRGRRRRRRALGRAEVDDRGDRRGQARDLDLIDRRAGRDVDRDRQLLAGHQRHAHVVHLGVRGASRTRPRRRRRRRARWRSDGGRS